MKKEVIIEEQESEDLNDIMIEELKLCNEKMQKDLKVFIPDFSFYEDEYYDEDGTVTEYWDIYNKLEDLLRYKYVDLSYLCSMSSVIYNYFPKQKEYIYQKLAKVTEKKFNLYKVFVKTIKEIIDYSKIDEECLVA